MGIKKESALLGIHFLYTKFPHTEAILRENTR